MAIIIFTPNKKIMQLLYDKQNEIKEQLWYKTNTDTKKQSFHRELKKKIHWK